MALNFLNPLKPTPEDPINLIKKALDAKPQGAYDHDKILAAVKEAVLDKPSELSPEIQRAYQVFKRDTSLAFDFNDKQRAEDALMRVYYNAVQQNDGILYQMKQALKYDNKTHEYIQEVFVLPNMAVYNQKKYTQIEAALEKIFNADQAQWTPKTKEWFISLGQKIQTAVTNYKHGIFTAVALLAATGVMWFTSNKSGDSASA